MAKHPQVQVSLSTFLANAELLGFCKGLLDSQLLERMPLIRDRLSELAAACDLAKTKDEISLTDTGDAS